MEENRFDVLVDVLKIMDTESVRESDLGDGIKNVLNHFDRSFTSDQKDEVVKELRGFKEKKKEKHELETIRKKIDEERYKDILESFCRSDMGEW